MSNGKVAIVLRTKNRKVFLKRAILESIIPQKFRDYNVYIVNDGGEVAYINDLISTLPEEMADRFVLVHLPFSLGRGGALAAGFSHTSEKYLHIHNDDDILEPMFLEKTVAYLEEDKAEKFSGVKTSFYDVHERIINNEVIERYRIDKNLFDRDNIENYIYVMSRISSIPPISVLFRRSCLLRVGGVDAGKNYAEEIDLFTRMMQWGEIGIIKDLLCVCHHNEEENDNYSVRDRNKLIRDALLTGNVEKICQAELLQKRVISIIQNNSLNSKILFLRKNIDLVTENIKSVINNNNIMG
ncbi:glycosyltransferase [Acetobacteraceae bacterium ESL0709]|nr:glycosyltransferase [Acetobacteraceae bacterium ESL0697]MDF7679012.1 glycosyltransferase [Acetobacteraceae bacterium ESL0709]